MGLSWVHSVALAHTSLMWLELGTIFAAWLWKEGRACQMARLERESTVSTEDHIPGAEEEGGAAVLSSDTTGEVRGHREGGFLSLLLHTLLSEASPEASIRGHSHRGLDPGHAHMRIVPLAYCSL